MMGVRALFRTLIGTGLFLHATAWADLTIHANHSPGVYGGVDREVIYLSDNQLRIDRLEKSASDGAPADGAASSVLLRFSGQPAGMLYLDHALKSAQILSSLRLNSTNQNASEVRIVKQADIREMLGYTAQRYDFSFTGSVDPLVLLGQQLPTGMAAFVRIDLQVNGTAWVAPDMLGASELADFFDLLSKRQLDIHPFGQSGSATTQDLSILSPGLSTALTAVAAQITSAGFPLKLQTQFQMNIYPQGSVAILIQGMLETLGIDSQQNTESVVTVVNTNKVPTEFFYGGLLPPGYSLNTP
jgi:hypothetical protein